MIEWLTENALWLGALGAIAAIIALFAPLFKKKQEGKGIGQSKVVADLSAGCQVAEVSSAHDYILMPLARKQEKKGLGHQFTWSLFESEDFQAM